jgi:fructokinase
VNPEMGHIRILHNSEKDPFPGICPYHGDCLEGLASGAAINKRIGKPAETIDDNHLIWDIEADYIGQAISNLILILSPKIIILGGGVMHRSFLFNKIRKNVQEILNQYVQHIDIIENIDHYIVPPLLGNNAGVLGAIALAKSR